LSKLFNVYGPNSAKKKRKTNKEGYSSKGRSLKTSRHHSAKRDLISSNEQSGENSDNDETIVIQLMTNMFSKKKSVKDKLQMDPNISVD
jgi:hypothetical protein